MKNNFDYKFYKDAVFLDDDETKLFYYSPTKTLHTWCPVRREATPISDKKALKQYRKELNSYGRQYFKVGPARDWTPILAAGLTLILAIVIAGVGIGLIYLITLYPPIGLVLLIFCPLFALFLPAFRY